jgi:cell division inhibitor SulA/protein ImuA
MPALRELTQRKSAADRKWVIFIAPPFIPYAPALAQRGIDIERLLLVHPTVGSKNCLWAVEQAVRSGSGAAVLAWLQTADGIALRRLQLASEQQRCWTVLFRPMSALSDRSPAALRIRLFIEDAVTKLQILKSRGGRPAIVNLSTDRQGWRKCRASQEQRAADRQGWRKCRASQEQRAAEERKRTGEPS